MTAVRYNSLVEPSTQTPAWSRDDVAVPDAAERSDVCTDQHPWDIVANRGRWPTHRTRPPLPEDGEEPANVGGLISDQPASRRSWNACWPYTIIRCTVKTVSGFSLAYAPSPGQ